MFERETRGNTLSTLPSRHLRFVIDPSAVVAVLQDHVGTLDLIRDLQSVSPSIDLHFLLPSYLGTADEAALKDRLGDLLIVIESGDGMAPFVLGDLPKADAARLTESGSAWATAQALLGLADATQADAIVTNASNLVDTRWSLRVVHRMRIVPVAELPDIVEICSHGHGLFWSSKNRDRKSIIDIYYATTNERCRSYFEWVLNFSRSSDNSPLKDELHSALINRFSFLLYARDLVRFYEIQLDHFWRRGLMQRFVFPLGYHVTHFYLLLWGMLEQLTVIAKHACALSLRERDCGIRSSLFWKEMATVKPNLKTFVESRDVAEWIGHMADMRHAAAHQTIPLPTMVLQETEESQKDASLIRSELRKKYALFYSLMPKAYIEKIEPDWIMHWRVEHMKQLLTTSVLIRKPDEKGYFRDPVGSIDHDLELLTAVMDKFLTEVLSFPTFAKP